MITVSLRRLVLIMATTLLIPGIVLITPAIRVLILVMAER
jgi:hypothetical protein